MQRTLASLNETVASTSGRDHVGSLPRPSQGGWVGGRPCISAAKPLRPSRRHMVTVQAADRPSLTLRQRWLSVKHDVYEKVDDVKSSIKALPPIAAIIRLLHALQQFLQPCVERYEAAREVVQEWWGVRVERYREFIGEETKRKWEWQGRHEAEHQFWLAVVQGLFGIFTTVFWEAITPVSFAIAVLPPLWVAWSLHDNLLRSPIFYAMLLMMPLKFPPGVAFRWI